VIFLKVLITGGCGFIGSHVADRFYEAGHDIIVIDNLSSGRMENLDIKYKLFKYSVEDPQCEEVFSSVRPDAVIHFAAQADVNTSMKNPYLDTRSNILGTVNMLDLSARYGAGKFIFASSAAVYGNTPDMPLTEESKVDPLSPYGMSKSVGEFYCRKWKELYGLDTISLRFSNVYGPRQGTVGEGGVISIFMQRALKNQDLVVFGDGNQTRDFIFVGDLAEAVYRASNSSACGIFNLSTNTENSVNELIRILGDIHSLNNVVYTAPRSGDIMFSRLDNSKLVKELDWKPDCLFAEGIGKTFEWFKGYITG